jgi:hypothetical protein
VDYCAALPREPGLARDPCPRRAQGLGTRAGSVTRGGSCARPLARTLARGSTTARTLKGAPAGGRLMPTRFCSLNRTTRLINIMRASGSIKAVEKALLAQAPRQGIIHLGVGAGRGLSSAGGAAEAEAPEMSIDLGARERLRHKVCWVLCAQHLI